MEIFCAGHKPGKWRHGRDADAIARTMIRYDRNFQGLALCLAALAGYVDAIGFLKSGGLFVSFMSGNSTRMAVGIVEATALGFAAAALIALFVAGVFLNNIVSAKVAFVHRKVIAMSGVAFLLCGAAVFQSLGFDLPTIGILCVAMGASNTIFRRDGEVSIGVTYMTGTLVKLGDKLAEAALGGSRTAWIPYVLLWFALVCGGILGTTAYLWYPGACIWFASAFAVILVGVTHRFARDIAA